MNFTPSTYSKGQENHAHSFILRLKLPLMSRLKLSTSYLGKWESLSKKKKRNKVQEIRAQMLPFHCFLKDCAYIVIKSTNAQ